LDDLGDVVLEGEDEGLQDEADSQDLGDDNEGLDVGGGLGTEGEIGDDGVDGEGEGEVEGAGEDGEDEEGEDVLAFWLEDAEEAFEGGEVAVAVMAVVIMAATAGGCGVAEELLAFAFFGVDAGGFGGSFRLNDGVFDWFVDAFEAEVLGELGARDGGGGFFVIVVVGDPDFEGGGPGDDEVFFGGFAPEDNGVVGVGVPDGAGDRFESSGGFETEFFNGKGELGERVTLGATVNDLKKLIDAFDVELVSGGLTEAGQEIDVDISGVFFVVRGGHSRWSSGGNVPILS